MPETGLSLQQKNYDFVFCGMGCASLSLLTRMIASGAFSDKTILLLDKEPKIKNDRTWCFWEKENGFFDSIVYKKWPRISFLSEEFSSTLDIDPYVYKMIKGIDFYNYCLERIRPQKNIDIAYAAVDDWSRQGDGTRFVLNGQTFNLGNPVVFDSIYRPGDHAPRVMKLLQHFKGWTIETGSPVFDPGVATIMDFRVHQRYGTAFAYVLPVTATRALVEYTLFTKTLLEKEQYDEELKNYIESFLGINDYSVTEEEFGVIPMTNEKLTFKGRGWQIGTAGGQTKASSGFTFQFIQKQSARILDSLLHNKPLDRIPGTARRFRFYDNTLLHILYHDKVPGKNIFTRLFRRNKAPQVLAFLDNESSLGEELKIIASLPTWPFLKAAMRQL